MSFSGSKTFTDIIGDNLTVCLLNGDLYLVLEVNEERRYLRFTQSEGEALNQHLTSLLAHNVADNVGEVCALECLPSQPQFAINVNITNLNISTGN